MLAMNKSKKNGVSSDLINAKREELKNLNIEPVSVAKFFYEKGAKNIALIQRLIYLAFLKVLQEKNILLFTEEWQAWSGGPVIESVFRPMSDHLDKYNCNYEKLFANFPQLKNKEVFPTLEEVYNEYQNYKKDRKEFMFFDKVLGKPWQLARCGLTDELDHQKIKLGDIVDCINQEKLQKETTKANEIFPFLCMPRQKLSEYGHYG
jgi:uncharacterized phage-associated protein